MVIVTLNGNSMVRGLEVIIGVDYARILMQVGWRGKGILGGWWGGGGVVVGESST